MDQVPTVPGKALSEGTEHRPAKIVSLAAARNRRQERREPRPAPPELEELDLRGVDLERMTHEAREHYWFNLNKHARHLYVSACDLSMSENDHPYSPICVHHIREAELRRVGLHRRNRHFGLIFFLDAMQILGAAACGALATKPEMFSAAGIVPLAAALMITAGVFVVREAAFARTGA